MIYLAPRQGLFAIIILVSMGLHLLFFVISQEHRLTGQYQAVLDREVLLLADELSAPMSHVDTVSMSVIANNYLKNDNIERIAIYTNKETLLLSVGQEANQGIKADTKITLDNKVLGTVQTYAPKIGRAQIIVDNWLFLSATLVLYGLIFFIYSYVARPTKELQQQMAKDIRSELLALGVLPATFEEPSSVSDLPKPPPQTITTTSKEPVIDENSDNVRVVQICFEDNYGLLETVDHRSKSIYFALYNQLLDRALRLLSLPLFVGVSVSDVVHYDSPKATVVLRADNSDAKVALAALMLAKLMNMLSQVVYDKHRELKYFCLPVRTLVSKPDSQDAITTVAKKHSESPLLLLNASDLEQIAIYAELGKLSELTSVEERESRYLIRMSPAMNEQLLLLRQEILLAEEA